MRDELAVGTIENLFQIERNHPMIQQRPNNEVIIELNISAYLLTLNSTMFCGVVGLNSDASGYFRLQL